MVRTVALDRSLEGLPLFRLSDSPDDTPITSSAENGGRWRVLPSPGDRSPGTFDQDVYVELMRRYADAGNPADGAVSFSLHAFLHSMGRRVDGRTYEQLRASLVRLHRTVLESEGAYQLAGGTPVNGQFALLSAVVIERRRVANQDQLVLFDDTTAPEPGSARVVIAAPIRGNLIARHVVTLSVARYVALTSPVARRLYRLLELARLDGRLAWRVSFEQLREILPLTQRYPSHLQRVLEPAHDLLVEAGILRGAVIRREPRRWHADYVLGSRGGSPGARGIGPESAE
jgi:plasmid replication initiation protein